MRTKASTQEDKKTIILIHPPVSKPSEPPAGLARIAGALRHHAITCRIVDANLEGLLYLMSSPCKATDTWTIRACRHLKSNLKNIQSTHMFNNIDQYIRSISDIGRILQKVSAPYGVQVGLANYQSHNLSPLKSADLMKASENPESNPFYPYFRKRLLDLMEEDGPSIIGFSLNYLSQALCTFAMAGFIKKYNPGIRIILGGGLMTSWIKRPHWQNEFKGLVDDVIAGPGEEALLTMLGVKDILHYYTPDFNDFPVNDYLSPGHILPYSASTGCYWNKCSFCPERAEGNQYLPIPKEQAISDIAILSKKLKPSLMHIVDNAISPQILNTLCEYPPDVPWYGFARITKQLSDPDFCLKLKHSGCVMLKLGIESGDQRVLDGMNKGIDINTVSFALKALKKAGIATYVYLLFGTPSETELSARKTLEFTAMHREEITFLNLAIFNLPIFSEESAQMVTSEFYEGDLSLYTSFVHPLSWDRSKVRQFLDKEFKRHRAIQPILKNDPPVFTSNHAPFFVML